MRRVLIVTLMLTTAAGTVLLVDVMSRGMVQRRLAERLPDAPRKVSAELAELATDPTPLLYDAWPNGVWRTGDASHDEDHAGSGALGRLVAAAVGDDPSVAPAAQRQVERLIESGRPSSQTPRLRRRLAAALRASGPGEAPEWTAGVARRLLRLAASDGEAAPTSVTQGLLEDCEAVLAAATASRREASPLADVGADAVTRPRLLERTPEPFRRADRRKPLTAGSSETPSSRLSSAAPQPSSQASSQAPGGPEPPGQEPFEGEPWFAGPPEAASITKPGADPSPADAPEDMIETEPRPFVPPRAISKTPGARDNPPAWNPDWAPPAPPRTSASPRPLNPEARLPDPAPDPARLSDRELLERFLPIAKRAGGLPAAVGPARRPLRRGRADSPPEPTLEDRLRRAVKERGLGGVATRQVELLFSDSEEDRQRLVETLLTTRSGGAPRLLLILATDRSPAVRHDAIRALGGASDQRLVEVARRLAREDTNPRVARLANEPPLR